MNTIASSPLAFHRVSQIPLGINTPVWAGSPLSSEIFSAVRRRAILYGCKWDAQVGDTCTLAKYPLLTSPETWQQLSLVAEQLACETVAAELEVLANPVLIRKLGFPRALRHAFARPSNPTPAAARVMRFDLHWTTDGWKISEVNSDVPGGFTESSFFTTLMAEHVAQAHPAGNPADRIIDSLRKQVGTGSSIGLLSAPRYIEDQQIMSYFAERLREIGIHAHLARPEQIEWRDGYAHLNASWHQGRLDALVRFYQAEWLAQLPNRFGWQNFFFGAHTPLYNPGVAAIAESKRFPVLWPELKTRLSTWRQYLPETCGLREVDWQSNDEWVIKLAMSNTGDSVFSPSLVTAKEWSRIKWHVRLFPAKWVAQRRFQSIPISTPDGPMHACIGVYTVDGKVAGAYARLSNRALIDYTAIDAALLVCEHE